MPKIGGECNKFSSVLFDQAMGAENARPDKGFRKHIEKCQSCKSEYDGIKTAKGKREKKTI